MLIKVNNKLIKTGNSLIGVPEVLPIDISNLEVWDTADVKANSGDDKQYSNAWIVGLVFSPSKDITFTTMSVYSGRSYTKIGKSNSNTPSNFVCYIAEVPDYTTDKDKVIQLMHYSEAVTYDTRTSTWLSSQYGTGSSASTNNDGSYGETQTIQNTILRKYTSKLANGNQITLQAGHLYAVGLNAGSHNSFENDINTLVIRYPGANYKAIKRRRDNTPNISYIDKPNYLPYIEFDGVPFQYFNI